MLKRIHLRGTGCIAATLRYIEDWTPTGYRSTDGVLLAADGAWRPAGDRVREHSRSAAHLARSPRLFLEVRAACERCGARLGVPVARLRLFRARRIVDGAGRDTRIPLQRAIGVCALLPQRARGGLAAFSYWCRAMRSQLT